MRELKFRAWDKEYMYEFGLDGLADGYILGTGKELKGCVLMQFTGLKDKNGKEIYEGDVVRYNKQLKWVAVVVEYHDKAASFVPYARSKRGHYRQFEIIGNIYESPELLPPKSQQTNSYI